MNDQKVQSIVDDATPAQYFKSPPYRAELFSKDGGWSGVMNAQGVNVLTFKSKPGAVITSIEIAEQIAAKWNKEQQP